MKKKLFNRIMFFISLIYLMGAMILIITQNIQWKITNLFNTDGLALLGCIFAFGELYFSKRNVFSKKINQILVFNKLIKYRIGMVVEMPEEKTLDYWLELFEDNLKRALYVDDLSRKIVAETRNDCFKVYYEPCGCMVDIYRIKEGEVGIRIEGRGKFGKLHSRRHDILYVCLLVEIINNKFIQDESIRKNGNIRTFELSVHKKGSQLSCGDIFNDELTDIGNYDIKIMNPIRNDIQISLSDEEITMRMIDVKSIYDGFDEFTNILCTIE